MPGYRTPIIAAVAALTAATAAHAHMPYVLPTLFDLGGGDHVTVQSSFAEDAFVPEVAMRDAPFHLVGPNGEALRIGTIAYLRDLTVFEADIPADGTYRVSTGQRAGRKGKMFRVGDKWEVRGEGAEAPPGAGLVDVQSMTLAEAFVTRGNTSPDSSVRHQAEIRSRMRFSPPRSRRNIWCLNRLWTRSWTSLNWRRPVRPISRR